VSDCALLTCLLQLPVHTQSLDPPNLHVPPRPSRKFGRNGLHHKIGVHTVPVEVGAALGAFKALLILLRPR